MPTYDYVCRKCGHRFEQFQPMTESPLAKCPKCGRDALERLIGPGAGILFKGSGFYETDYKRPAAPKSDAPAPSRADKPDKPAAGGPTTGGKAAGDTPSGPSKGPAKSD
jgi:putative FmdB family regulatory protein